MCCEDLQIWRNTAADHVTFSIPTTADRILRSDRSRMFVSISSDDADDFYVRFGAAPSAANGILIPAGSGPWYFGLLQFGRIIQLELWAFTAAAAAFTVGGVVGTNTEDCKRGGK